MQKVNKLLKLVQIYGILGSLYLLISLVRTKILFKNARLIRFPIDIRGKQNMVIGKAFTTGKYCRIEVNGHGTKIEGLEIGNNVQINDSVHIAVINSVKIGNNVLIASKVFISDHNHGNYGGNDPQSSPLVPPYDRVILGGKVVIEDNVWIGEFVSILPNVTIGKGSIIGTLSVVNKNIPEYCIAVGNPAHAIKKFNFKSQKWEPIIKNL